MPMVASTSAPMVQFTLSSTKGKMEHDEDCHLRYFLGCALAPHAQTLELGLGGVQVNPPGYGKRQFIL
jgi:hypothetical protein